MSKEEETLDVEFLHTLLRGGDDRGVKGSGTRQPSVAKMTLAWAEKFTISI
jgi:hypothetical protein